MKFRNKTGYGVMVGFFLIGGGSMRVHAQSPSSPHSGEGSPPSRIEKAIELRRTFEANETGYANSLKVLVQVRREAHKAHDEKGEAEALREIKKTLALQKIFRTSQNKARREIKAGQLGLITFGKRSSLGLQCDEILAREYHIRHVADYGCVVTEENRAEREGYNSVMKAEIERRYGTGFLGKLYARVAEERKQAEEKAEANRSEAAPVPHL